jgi:hypothetical protein
MTFVMVVRPGQRRLAGRATSSPLIPHAGGLHEPRANEHPGFWVAGNHGPKLFRTVAGMRLNTYVYFVTTMDRSLVKIGLSFDPDSRLSSLLGGSPIHLEMLAAVPGARRDEFALHRRYLAHHSHYEWFHSTPEMMADIDAISRGGELPTAFRGGPRETNPLAQIGIRATPEWRAKMSEVHKACWANIKRNRAAERQAGRAQ